MQSQNPCNHQKTAPVIWTWLIPCRCEVRNRNRNRNRTSVNCHLFVNTFYLSTGLMLVEFTSDNSANAEGFTAAWASVANVSLRTCMYAWSVWNHQSIVCAQGWDKSCLPCQKGLLYIQIITYTHLYTQLAPGMRVKRGPDWEWLNEDSGGDVHAMCRVRERRVRENEN